MQNDDSVTKITWEQLLEEYFFSKNLRPDTEWSYCKVVRVFREFIGDILPGEVTVRDVQRYRRYVLKEQKRREVTWNNKVAHLRAIMGFGIKMKLLPQTENPLVEASVASTEKKKKTLSDNQMLRVYLVVQRFAEAEEQNMVNSRRRNAIYSAWYWLTVLDVLRYTGMRFNQLKHIRVRDVCPDESIIDLKLEGSKTHREWGVPLVAPLKVSMEKLLERARQCGAGDDDYLFDVCRFSEPISADRYQYCPIRAHQTVRSFFRRLSRECGFPVSPHRFRHTLATRLMKYPERNLHLVKSILGHRSLTTTMGYVDVCMESAAQTLEDALSLYTDERTVSKICKGGNKS
ncbi:site-specific integrase [Escherichia coli]